jgi:MurNAc alpha-1-phosphate uridylyltransferase
VKALILAAGRGERMRPLTNHVPKPLLEVGGKALIVWHIEKLRAAGIREIVINHSHLGAQIEAALGDGRRWDVNIAYSREGEALETAGGIAFALPLLGAGPFAVVNGDVYTDYPYSGLAREAGRLGGSQADAHLILVANPPHHPKGDFGLRERTVTLEPPRLTFSGMGVYRPELFAAIAPGARAQLAPLLRERMALGRVSGELHAGAWRDVGTPERLAAVDAELRAARR